MYGQQVMCWAAKLGTQDGTFFGFIGGSVDQIDIARMDCLTKFIMASQSPFYIEVVYFRSWRCPKFRPLFQTFHQSIFHEASSQGGANRSSDSIMDRIGRPNHLPIGSHWFPLVPIGYMVTRWPKKANGSHGFWNPFVSGSWHTKHY